MSDFRSTGICQAGIWGRKELLIICVCVTLTLAVDYAYWMVYGNEAKQLAIKALCMEVCKWHLAEADWQSIINIWHVL